MLVEQEKELDQYDIRRSPVGQWEVYDLSTGLVVVLDGTPLRGLYVGEAHQAAGLLNEERARQARRRTH